MLSIFIACAVIIIIAAGISAVLFRGLATARSEAPTPDWVQSLSARRYQPMERLLQDRDLRFLQSFPAVSPAFTRRFRAERRRIFRGYVRSLDRDFSRVCAGLRAIVATAEEDRSELAMLVARQQFAFRMAMFQVEFRLLLHAAGAGPVDTRKLIGCFDSLRIELRQLTPVGAAAAA
jgi:hypothetical protein